MARNDSALRILEIGRLLELTPQGLTVKEIKERLEGKGRSATIRTIYRDIQAASEFFPIFEKEKAENGGSRFAMDSTMKVSKYLVLHPRELFALYFARGVLQPLEQTPFFADLQRVFAKLDELIGAKGRSYLEEMARNVFFDPMPKWGLGTNPDILETIRAACEERHAIGGIYVSTKDNTPKPRKLGPHFLYYAKGGVYLVAEDLETKAVKTYSLPRFQSAEMLSDEYVAETLDPSEFFASSFGIFAADATEDVELEFEACVARFVSERQWHASQRVVRLEGGRARISFSVALTPEFVAWVLGFGPNVRITKSTRLIELVVSQAAKVREMYWKKAG